MSHPSIVNVSEDQFQSEVLDADVPVVVDFWAEWCGPCRMLAPVLDEIAGEKGGAVKIAKVNVEENQELAARYQVRSIPLLLFFKGGEVRDQAIGLQPKQAIVSKLDALV
jgi:thioredoxin 1